MLPVHIQLEASILGKAARAAALSVRDHAGLSSLVRRLPLSLRNGEKVMAERSVAVDHATVHSRVQKILPRQETHPHDDPGRNLMVIGIASHRHREVDQSAKRSPSLESPR